MSNLRRNLWHVLDLLMYFCWLNPAHEAARHEMVDVVCGWLEDTLDYENITLHHDNDKE